MRHTKKWGIITWVLLLCMAVSACSGNQDKKDPEENHDNQTEQGTDSNNEAPPVIQAADKLVEKTKLVLFDGPSLMETSKKLSASVNQEALFVYDTRVNHNRIFSYTYPETMNQVVIFDFEGSVTMEIEITDAASLSDVVVRPLSYQVKPEVNGNKITFQLDYPANYTVEYQDGTVEDPADNALHIFSSLPEENVPDPENLPEDMIYIGPGVYKADAIPMESGKTLYLAGGAYVYGQIRAEQLQDVVIKGRGILSGSIYERTRASEFTVPIELRYCSNVQIEGITILDPAAWTIALYKCDGIEIDNLKIISARANSDGISVQSCSNVSVTGGFVRTWDDTLVVKNEDEGITKNVVFDQVVVWTDLAQSCEVGYETNGETMEDITFKNITILHNYHLAAMSIHNADNAEINRVTYQNITIEDAKMLGNNRNDGENDFLIDMTIAFSPEWSVSGGERGSINDVTISNIKVLSQEDTIVSRMLGESAQSNIDNIKIHNIEIAGRQITSKEELALAANDHVGSVEITNDGTVTGASILYPYQLDLKEEAVDLVRYETNLQDGLEVPAFSIFEIEESYMGTRITTSNTTILATHGTGTTLRAGYDDGSGTMETSEGPASNLIDGDRNTAFIARPYDGTEEEFAAVTIHFGELVNPGVARVYFSADNPFVKEYRVAVFVKKDQAAENYSRALSSTDFISSPSNGNYIDIKLSSTLECYELQLRFFKTESIMSFHDLVIQEIACYPSSLSTNKAIIDSSAYNDVYTADYLVDGNESTYWEAVDENAYFVLDLGSSNRISYINLHLPPILLWEPRTQGIEILTSVDGTNFTTAAASTEYVFDPAFGNKNTITLQEPVEANYIKLQWTSNSSFGGYGAQLSEIYVY